MFWVKTASKYLIAVIITLGLLIRSAPTPSTQSEYTRSFTRPYEFDYVSWTLDALHIKLTQVSLSTSRYIPEDRQSALVRNFLGIVHQTQVIEAQIELIYTNPEISDPEAAAAELRQTLADLEGLRDQLAPVAEAILQSQIGQVVTDMNLAPGGQPVPPIFYHVTEVPNALIVSPREIIHQDANISLLPDMNIEEMVALENDVENSLGVSALVVPIGGVGIYPTMVLETTHLPSLIEIVAHEWTHNFLTLRPLGLNYDTSPELRTINETTASISGKEIGQAVLERYYPDLAPKPQPVNEQPIDSKAADDSGEEPEQAEVVFDYRTAMFETRVTVDQLLAEGQIEQAEAYMEQRRQYLWDHGYSIRRLNQAYFAFHGAYADSEFSAAGVDPVGAAVRSLRAQSDTLPDFLYRIAWVTSFEELQAILDS